jgi:hypothetical protein
VFSDTWGETTVVNETNPPETDTPNEKATDTPDEEASDTPDDEASDTPDEEASDTPDDEPTETPDEEPTETPDEEPSETQTTGDSASDPVTDAPSDSESTTDERAVEVDTESLLLLPACESDSEAEAERLIQELATDIDACACTQLHRYDLDIDWICRTGDFGFHGTLVFEGRDKERTLFEQELKQRLAQAEPSCLPYDVWIDGQTRNEGEALVQTIVAACDLSEELVGRSMAAMGDESGVVQLVEEAWTEGPWSKAEVECANSALLDLSFPCLAGMGISGWPFPTIL